MYCKHFGLDVKPFAITPDPRFLFLSARHREALAHLLYGIGEGGGFVQLTGEVGTGKTTLCRALLEQLPDGVDVALILNPKLTAFELVATICDELKITYLRETESLKVLVDALNEHLLSAHARGRRTILVIDEAQNLSIEVLEQIRLLTNLETAQSKLLQIVLIGQPELQTLLARNELRQLSQRITARYHLGSLDEAETEIYIHHRLKVSGGHGDQFSKAAIEEVHKLSAGIPRLINIICDRAMLGAYVEDKRAVDRKVLQRAAREVLPEFQAAPGNGARMWPWAAMIAFAGLIAAAGWFGRDWYTAGPAVEGLQIDALAPAAGTVVMSEANGIEAKPLAEPEDPAIESNVLVPPDPLELDLLPAPSDLSEQLSVADEGAGLQAWSSLFELWNIDLYLNDDLRPCDQAVRQGLRCLVRSGNWTQLRSFDRPAVLQLVAPNGKRVSVLLRSLSNSDATVELGGQSRTVALSELDQFWLGQFTLLWRPPVGSRALRRGDQGQDIVWLRELLERLQPGAGGGSANANVFDQRLTEQVRRFQAQHLLEPDGVVGTMTLIHLNSADAHSGGPRLSSLSAKGSG